MVLLSTGASLGIVLLSTGASLVPVPGQRSDIFDLLKPLLSETPILVIGLSLHLQRAYSKLFSRVHSCCPHVRDCCCVQELPAEKAEAAA